LAHVRQSIDAVDHPVPDVSRGIETMLSRAEHDLLQGVQRLLVYRQPASRDAWLILFDCHG
jgi:hypothetical protein